MPRFTPSAVRRRAAAIDALFSLARHLQTAGLVIGLFGYFGGFLLAVEVAIGRLMP